MSFSNTNCCVPQCTSRKGKNPDLSFHRFPRDEDRRMRWILNLRIGKKVSKAQTVCSKHFEKSDFFPGSPDKLPFLKRSSVPSQCLPKVSILKSKSTEKIKNSKETVERCENLTRKSCNKTDVKVFNKKLNDNSNDAKTGPAKVSERLLDQYDKVCGEHSISDNFILRSKRNYLKNSTIPSVFDDDPTYLQTKSTENDCSDKSHFQDKRKLPEMVDKKRCSCCVVGCNMRAGTNLLSKIKMFNFPTNFVRRQKWTLALRRKDWMPTQYSKICSQHFITGKPAVLQDTKNPDWVPSLNLGYEKFGNCNTKKKLKRYPKKKQRNVKNSKSSNVKTVTEKSESSGSSDEQATSHFEENGIHEEINEVYENMDDDSTINQHDGSSECDQMITYYMPGQSRFSLSVCDVTDEQAFESAKTLLSYMESQNDTDLADVIAVRRCMRTIKEKILTTEN